MHPGTNLRIISFNTNLYYKENFWLYEPTIETDPDGQLAWLVTELQAAEDAKQRVYLAGHMPMGTNDALHDGSNYFDQIVNRYSAIIAGLFSGHTHKDEFELAYSDYKQQTASNAVAMSYTAPAMTPTSGMPAFRVYSVDPDTWGILDYTMYIADMNNPTYQISGPVWTKYYSAKETYGPLVSPPLTNAAAELTPAFWHNVTTVLAQDATQFTNYYARKSRGWNVQACTDTCQTTEICQLRAAQAQYNCATITPGVSFKTRDESSNGHVHANERACDGSGVSRILSLMAENHKEFVNAVKIKIG